MERIRYLSNQFQKRTLRPIIAHAEAVPYPGVLHPSFRNTDGSFRAPLAADTNPIARSADAFLFQGGLLPGQVFIQADGDSYVLATGVDSANVRPGGLLGNWVGGNMDELGQENNIAVWQGAGSQYEILAPAFDDTGLAAAYAAATPGNKVKLFAGPDGRLTANITPGAKVPVALLRERTGPGKIVVDLLV